MALSQVPVNFTAKEIASKTTATIKINGMKEFIIRTWIVNQLIGLAVYISWFNIETEFIDENGEKIDEQIS